MAFKYFIVIISLFTVVYVQDLAKNNDNYGPCKINLEYFIECKGSKSKNATHIVRNSTDSMELINITFFSDTKLDEVRIQVYNLKDNKRTFLWHYKLTDPCKHISLAQYIKRYLETDKNCVVKKGVYKTIFNLREILDQFIGNTFFYGRYAMKGLLSSTKGNIGCFETCLLIEKK